MSSVDYIHHGTEQSAWWAEQTVASIGNAPSVADARRQSTRAGFLRIFDKVEERDKPPFQPDTPRII